MPPKGRFRRVLPAELRYGGRSVSRQEPSGAFATRGYAPRSHHRPSGSSPAANKPRPKVRDPMRPATAIPVRRLPRLLFLRLKATRGHSQALWRPVRPYSPGSVQGASLRPRENRQCIRCFASCHVPTSGFLNWGNARIVGASVVRAISFKDLIPPWGACPAREPDRLCGCFSFRHHRPLGATLAAWQKQGSSLSWPRT